MLKRKILLIIIACIVFLAVPAVFFSGAGEQFRKMFDVNEPDLPPFATKKKSDNREKEESEGIDKEEYLTRRIENLDMLQGFDTAKQDSRVRAIREMDIAEAKQQKLRAESPAAAWTALGPAPIPISAGVAWSGRTSAIAVHPTDPNIVYVGTAQGGLYRTLNGGTTWTPLMDNAATLAIGAVAISPSDPTIVYVGTGESTQCGSGCFIGVGLYRINTADTTPVLTGPLNKDASNNDVFSGRAISEVLVHPTDPNTLFVATTSGVAGIGSITTGLPLPVRGIYRTTNATAPNPTFTLLPITGVSDRNVTDMVMDPADPNRIYAGVIGVLNTIGAGVFMTSNALDASPTFTQLLTNTPQTASAAQGRIELAANHVAGTTTVIAATGEGTGTTYRSINGAAFTTLLDNNFCNPQCFYDIAVAIDPTNANNVYLGGSPTLVFGRSSNGGTSYTSSSSGLHVDTQAITVAPSNPSIIYFGSDGGIWRSTNAGVNWTTLNNTTYSATQFMSIAVHPTEANYTLGGTQDNGTQYLVAADGTTWVNSDGGDGGFAVIDQTSTSATSITAYHTYYNQTNSQIGFTRATTTVANGDPNWSGFLGCGGTANGIACADATLFYAPMVGGPVASDSAGKNTLYFGTNKLYRSANTGTTMTAASQALTGTPNERVSAIGISPQNDAVRLIGSTIGKVYYSNTAGAVTMTDVTGTLPARYVGRIAFSPTDQNTAYVALNGYGIPGQHVMKTTNLNAPTPTWTSAGSGIPDVPTNALVVDPLNSNHIYAGTDIGVFVSYDGGAHWGPLGTGLPRVAVFGIAIQPTSRILRIATHGRGMYQIPVANPPTATVAGRVLTAEGRGVRNATVTMTDPLGAVLQVRTGPFGNYRFDNVPTGTFYDMAVVSRRFTFAPNQIVLSDSLSGVNFIAQ
ncbi:MAG: carboxypeptidase-like regulatory domain-containing protein [Pyrinomonadaceae bacterium]